jgi:hypothetical protein
MRTRPRDMARLLATLRHSAQCRALRAATAKEAMRRAKEEADEEQALSRADGGPETPGESDTRCNDPAHRRMH